jgi:hypothetical protein
MEWNMGCDLETYEKTGYMREENIKNDRRTGGRARNVENMN